MSRTPGTRTGMGDGSGALRTLFSVGTLAGLSDGQLVERYLLSRNGGESIAIAIEAEAVFAAIVDRHGSMVLNVCRAILGDRHDAEDACQATFLVLTRRAGSIRRGESVASWLHGVARRIASRARRDLARRREQERRRLERIGPPDEPTAPPPPDPFPELYEELDQLPEPFRAAVVLCDLEGHPYDRAAGLLGCPIGTLQSRLARGRDRLRKRLERRGLGPAMLAIGAAPPPIPRALASAIVRGALSIGGNGATAAVPAAVAAMAGAELRRQIMRRFVTVGMMFLTAGLTTAAVGLGSIGGGEEVPLAPRKSSPAARNDPAGVHVRVVDLDGMPAVGVAVEVHQGDRPGSFTTDADGLATIPRAVVGEHGFVIARRGNSLAWAWPEHRGKVEPLTMQLLPIDRRLEGEIVDWAKRPLAGIRVRAYAFSHRGNGNLPDAPELFEAILAPAITDADGHYAISAPRDSFVTYRALHPRYVGPWIVARPDSRALATTTLEPAGGIAGRVIDAVTGRPIAGASVGAGLIEHHPRFFGCRGEATTNDQGRFFVGGLPPAVYNVMLRQVPGRPRATSAAVECLRVRAGADTEADLVAIEGRPIRGVVLDRDTGKPVPGTLVGCYGPARPLSSGEVGEQRTDDQGQFAFYVPPGEQHIYCTYGYGNSRLDHKVILVPAQGEVGPIRLLMRPQGRLTPQPPTAMLKAEVAKAAVPQPALAPAPPIAPKAGVAPNPNPAPETRTVTGHVRDPRGRPLGGVHLWVPPENPGPIAERLQGVTVATDRDGLFIFPGLPRGPIEIRMGRASDRNMPVNLPADRESVEWTFTPIPDPGNIGPPKPVDEPIPPALRDRLTFVDLDPPGNDYLADGPGGDGNDLNRLPRGIHKMGDTFFRISEKMVHLKGRERPELPSSVKGITVGARGRMLHFLHSAQGGLNVEGKIVAVYVIHYADGTHEQGPVVYARDITNWMHRDPGRSISRAIPAWTGPTDMTERQSRPGLMVRLFEMSWTNPHPEKPIASLDFLSAGNECDPFLVALTLERD